MALCITKAHPGTKTMEPWENSRPWWLLLSLCVPAKGKLNTKTHSNLLRPVICLTHPTAALRKTVLTSGRLSQEYQSGREGVWPCHRQHLWVGKPLPSPTGCPWKLCSLWASGSSFVSGRMGRVSTSEVRGDFKQKKSILYKAKHWRGLPLLPSSHPTAYCLCSLFASVEGEAAGVQAD